ncbi:tRNA (adenosine(37)-N6)-dimethylallyltransferase MiaA [Wenzhouxiangella marina]|uniref:tRNA dimethylallyltransferase n=1 Tax=Wenzhouxiangella marina TaxID=1579979 RepID=A0A0K0XVF3_9GAMM|nr:tRNA (adenosine(37)-N6)-dimethylallyltransferase MiaA [Wenzhouxiangella marina]AKS41689.1 tRNA dimethylallyltransferase [Wenzhouxiangella marina]MBB6086550.1 tRNA dimethylallyltransferase [Wenzhouxiangella marina]
MVSDPRSGADLPPAVILTGPTAAGKTDVAMALADRFDVALISVDSAQVYRGLDIGAAKPDAVTLARYPHALIDIRDPAEAYSAADFVKDCEAAMREARAARRLPVLVGGTTLYLRALIYGLDPLPPADPSLREQLATELAEDGGRGLHAELASADSAAAARIRPNDPQRLLRAVEILRLTGKGPSHWQTGNRLARLDTLRLVITPSDRKVLHDRIALRFERMVAEGFLDEVAALRKRGDLGPDLPAIRSVGYRQAWDFLAGRFDQESFLQRARAATRQLAKRQLTALRQMRAALWYDSQKGAAIDSIFRQVQGFSKQLDEAAELTEHRSGPSLD